MTTENPDAPRIVLRYSLTDAEMRVYERASAARQQVAGGGSELSWIAYLGAFPVGLAGGFIGIAFGIGAHAFGGLVAALVGLGYISGYYIMHIVARGFRKRLAAVDRQKHSELGKEVTVEITRDGVSKATSPYRVTCSWSWFEALTRHEQVLILWTTRTMDGLVIPRRVLTPNEEARILELAAEHIASKP